MSNSEVLCEPSSSSSKGPKQIKVYYFLDNSDTPYLSVISTTNVVPTLGDFRTSFSKKGFKYFCKELEPDIGCEVKIELYDDSSILRKSANGLYELYLLSLPGYGTLPRAGTLPRNRNKISEDSNRQRRRRSLVEMEFPESGLEVGTGSHPASSLGTVVSRRAGEHLAELTSQSEDPYRFDESSRVSGMSSMYEPLTVGRRGDRAERVKKRKPRSERYRKPYVPSTIGSKSESSMSQELDRIIEVNISMRSANFLGITVACYNGAILVGDVNPDGAIGKDGRIEPGDQIIQVNEQSFENLPDKMAVKVLQDVAAKKRPFRLYVAKPTRNTDYDPLSALASETLPLDISLWVKTAAQCSEKQRMIQEMGVEDMSQTFDDGTLDCHGETDNDEEERILYAQRRNGIPRALLEEAERRRENEQNEQQHQTCVRLSIHSNPHHLLRALAKPDSGLQVKNRKWLKIPVPQSFIGRELVDWFLTHIEDVGDRKGARAVASKLLDLGLIKHVVSKQTFTEKCYYVFGENVLSTLNAENAPVTQGATRLEATTEVTYVGSPGPAGLRGRHPLQTIPHPLADQTWPISPITVADTTRQPRRTECESPVTNDYASMVGVESIASYGMGIARGLPSHSRTGALISRGMVQGPPPNTPLSGSAMMTFAPPNPSPCETEFDDDDKRRILKTK